MYRKILFCLDNSDHSLYGADMGLRLARFQGSSAIACHVYAARLHNDRFRQMEDGLPEEYRAEEKLRGQREVHDTLITKGLRIISDAYMDVFRSKAASFGITPECISREGKNFEEIVKEASCGYDLVVMGALGLGKTEDSLIGSVAERVVRRVSSDVLIARDNPDATGAILVAIDGSPLSYGGLLTALEIGKAFGLKVEALSVYDPEYHRHAFRSIAGVLSEEAGRLFRFKEQERLHEEVIDKGLARIYQGHLETASRIAQKAGVKIKTRLLSGKPSDEIIKYIKTSSPFMTVVGKTGAHATETLDIGSITEGCLRHAPSNMLISGRSYEPEKELDSPKDLLIWDEEAKQVLSSIPSFARGIVKGMAEDAARKEGVKKITVEFMRSVRKRMEG